MAFSVAVNFESIFTPFTSTWGQTRDLNDPDVARAREVEEEIFEAILRDEKK